LPCRGCIVHFIHPWGRETVEFGLKISESKKLFSRLHDPNRKQRSLKVGPDIEKFF
jgi:hypothetical protein